jgi:thiol-disulfide isomerase/thioredoxin
VSVTRRSVLAVAGLILSPLLLVSCGRDQPATVGVDTVSTDQREEPLNLSGTTLDGQSVSLAALRGKIVVLNAWASWCPPCRKEMPAFVSLDAGSKDAGVVVMGLNVTDDRAAAEALVDDLGVTYPSIVDADGALLASVPGVPPTSLPSTVILDREGRIAARVIGETDAVELATLIATVMGDSPPSA